MGMDKDEIKAYAKEVAEALGETNAKPISQIEALVEHAGRDFVASVLAETNAIEEQGGLKTDDNKRRRTKGGVFFYTVKGKLDSEIRQKIFPSFGQQSTAKVIEWDDRHSYVDQLFDDPNHGNARYACITLHGRPGQVVVEDRSVVMTLRYTHGKMPIPKGVPKPPETEMVYTVYMDRRHWDAVEETLEKYKADRMVIEGSLFMDTETESLAVLATSVTTKRLEKEARRASEAESQGAAPQKSTPDQKAGREPVTANTKLEKLYHAAETLRERIADMEAKGQKGVAMTRKLLRTTEKQIEVLEKSRSK